MLDYDLILRKIRHVDGNSKLNFATEFFGNTLDCMAPQPGCLTCHTISCYTFNFHSDANGVLCENEKRERTHANQKQNLSIFIRLLSSLQSRHTQELFLRIGIYLRGERQYRWLLFRDLLWVRINACNICRGMTKRWQYHIQISGNDT